MSELKKTWGILDSDGAIDASNFQTKAEAFEWARRNVSANTNGCRSKLTIFETVAVIQQAPQPIQVTVL